MDSSSHHPTFYEFLLEAELSHYFSPLKNDLKINSVAQLKYVEEEDLLHLGMSKPEQRRLKKFFHKYYPQTYLKKIKKMILSKGKEDSDHATLLASGSSLDKQCVKVPSKHIISVDNITINKELGTGEFGIVQQGVWTNEDGERIQVAIKCLCKERMQNKHMEFLKEAAIMHTIDHEHIVRLYGVALDTNSLMLITELAPLRSLLECLKEPALRPSFGIINLCEFAQQICDGMLYLENKRLIHRDLAARNILVFSKNKVKISDFGLSRALGVGKDYYQTNFNVNLKLPVAWCAPECINYLRFTSASDVWAYGVTLWEIFSYGFQPWAALTGQQILEAVDEPNFQRLEQPDCCPKEYYSLMLKCWQHDPSKRLKFSEISGILPECKPEQVQAIKDCTDQISNSKVKNDGLQYNIGDVITVLDKRPNVWKGATNNGKTGLFNPANTVTYLGRNLPTYHPPFSRAESKSGLYTSRRRICRDMISKPQGDFKHTGHVGLDGAFFGDISFLGEKYHQLPKQIVTPYKPQDDKERSNLSLNKLVSPEKSPLLNRSCSMKIFNYFILRYITMDAQCEIHLRLICFSLPMMKTIRWLHFNAGTWTVPRDLSEISKDETLLDVQQTKSDDYFKRNDKNECNVVSLEFDSLDFGPSLMEEVFKALGETNTSTIECMKDDSKHDEFQKTATCLAETGNGTEEMSFEPMSDNDEKINNLHTSEKLVNESDTDILGEHQQLCLFDENNSDITETEMNVNFKSEKMMTTHSNDKQLQDSTGISDESVTCLSSTSVTTTQAQDSTKKDVQDCQNNQNQNNTSDSTEVEAEINDPSPLRMLRSGMPVRPKIRGNKHGSNKTYTPTSSSNAHLISNQVGKRSTLGEPPPPPLPLGARERQEVKDKDELTFSYISSEITPHNTSKASPTLSFNPLPLPPRDRTKPIPLLKHHQRKHPLVLPGETNFSESNLIKQTSCPDVMSYGAVSDNDTGFDISLDNGATNYSKSVYSSPRLTTFGHNSNKEKLKSPPPKPSRLYNSNDTFENQLQTDVENLDNIPEEENYSSLSRNSSQDKLSVEKDFDTSHSSSITNTNAEEVRIIQRVLKSEQVTSEECVVALNETNWDIRKAVKYLRLQCVLSSYLISAENSKQVLIRCNWDVQQAANYLLATHSAPDETTEV